MDLRLKRFFVALFFVSVSALLLVACSSDSGSSSSGSGSGSDNPNKKELPSNPKKAGEMIAAEKNNCSQSFMDKLEKFSSTFIAQFDVTKYSSRREAKEAYKAEMANLYNAYQDELSDIDRRAAEAEQKFEGKDLRAFYAASDAAFDQQLENNARTSWETESRREDLPDNVLRRIGAIRPVKPDANQIKKDIVKRKIIENVSDAERYYSSDWTWVIEESEISNFSIDSVSIDKSEEYEVVVSLRLKSASETMFDAKMLVNYKLPEFDDWTIDYTQTLGGIQVVNSGNYKDCIKKEQDSDGWFVLKNTCDRPLEVGGVVFDRCNSTTYNMQVIIQPHSKKDFYCVSSFDIKYVERPIN